MGELLREVQVVSTESSLSTAKAQVGYVGTQTVQALQNEFNPGVRLVRTSKGSIPWLVLSLAIRVLLIKRIDLYNKSRMS